MKKRKRMLQILGGRLGYWCFSRGGGIYEEIFETFCGIVINRKLKTPFSVQRSTWGRFSQWKWALATNILWCKFCDVKFPPPKNNNGLGLGGVVKVKFPKFLQLLGPETDFKKPYRPAKHSAIDRSRNVRNKNAQHFWDRKILFFWNRKIFNWIFNENFRWNFLKIFRSQQFSETDFKML